MIRRAQTKLPVDYDNTLRLWYVGRAIDTLKEELGDLLGQADSNHGIQER